MNGKDRCFPLGSGVAREISDRGAGASDKGTEMAHRFAKFAPTRTQNFLRQGG